MRNLLDLGVLVGQKWGFPVRGFIILIIWDIGAVVGGILKLEDPLLLISDVELADKLTIEIVEVPRVTSLGGVWGDLRTEIQLWLCFEDLLDISILELFQKIAMSFLELGLRPEMANFVFWPGWIVQELLSAVLAGNSNSQVLIKRSIWLNYKIYLWNVGLRVLL